MLPFPSLSVSEFETYLQSTPQVQLVDVRTPSEYAEGHLSESLNIDVMSPGFSAKAQELLDVNRPVAVYCRSGKRSANAANQLTSKGFKVINLEGGIMAWIANKKETVK